MDNVEYKQCSKCYKKVPAMNLLIHELQCKGVERDMVIEQEPSQPYYMDEKQPNFSNYPKVPEKYRKEKIQSIPKPTIKEDSILCPKCSMALSITHIDDHIRDCPYAACRFCSEYYPKAILKEHFVYCPARSNNRNMRPETESSEEEVDVLTNRRNAPQLVRENSRASQQFFANDGNSVRTTFRPRPVSNNMMQVRTMERVPGGFVTRTVIMPTENTPFGHLGMMRNLSEDQSDPYSGEDEFFQEFTNHTNFIRLNRFLFNPSFLHQLLQQLANPNTGVDERELSKLETINYKKPKEVKTGEEDKCTICITEFNDGEELRILPCKHIFHPQCVDTWLVQNSHCPVCKLDVNTVLHR